jgi:murein DD-endopeptidase MepM/ murein hydrolase activator NlpD
MIQLLEHQRVRPRPPAIDRGERSVRILPNVQLTRAVRRPRIGRLPGRRATGTRGRRGRLLPAFRLPAFLRAAYLRRPRKLTLELFLAAGIGVCLLSAAWSGRAVPGAGSRYPAIDLPADAAYEAQLAEALVPEEQRESTKGALRPGVIQSLKVARYQVKEGDTLSRIAERFSLNLDTVLSYNDIRDVRRLVAGKILELPNTDGLKHRVSRGEFLGAIARRYGIELNGLLDWNDLDSSVIRPGQELFIPGARLKPQELNRILGRLFIYPARGRLSSGFGVRPDPFTGIWRFHNGVDIANDPGTPVLAAMSGKVAMIGYNANFGKYVIVSHSDGFQTLYGHLSEFQSRRGQSVAQGQVIGRMGNTGYSTGPHLHFSIFLRGEPTDPFKYLH